MLDLPGSLRGGPQRWQNWTSMGIPGRRVKGGGDITSNVTRVDDRNLRHLAHQEQGKQAWNQKECATC